MQGSRCYHVHPAHAAITVGYYEDMASTPFPLTESISVTQVVDSSEAQLSKDVKFLVRISDTNLSRPSFTISQKIAGSPPTVPLLNKDQVIKRAVQQLQALLRERAQEEEDRELSRRLRELADELTDHASFV